MIFFLKKVDLHTEKPKKASNYKIKEENNALPGRKGLLF